MSRFLGKFFLLIGPSGVGKGTIIKELKKRHSDWLFPISVTTRSKRPGEIEGKTYYFFSKKEFKKKEKMGEFLETACVHDDNYYGILKETIFQALREGKIIFREVDIQGAETIKKKIASENLITIFLLPPSLEILKKRITQRSPLKKEEVLQRMHSAKIEIKKASKCDFILQTEDQKVEKTVQDVEKIIKIKMNF